MSMKRSEKVPRKLIRRTIVSGLLTTGCLIGLSLSNDASKMLSQVPILDELCVKSAHAEVTERGEYGGCDWEFEDGVLTIKKSENGDGVLGPGRLSYWYYRPDFRKQIQKVHIYPGVIANEDSYGLFEALDNLTEIKGLDNLDVSQVKMMDWMLAQNPKLEVLNISSWQTSGVESMRAVFQGNKQLTKITGIEDLNTSSAEDIGGMFADCKKLKLTELNWDTSNAQDMYGMFTNAEAITKLDLSSFDTTSAKTIQRMFSDMDNLQVLDISNFNTHEVENVSGIFDYDVNLWQLKLGAKTKLSPDSGLPNVPGDNKEIPGELNYVNSPGILGSS